jgi:ATP synthase F1 complex assembly factor 2
MRTAKPIIAYLTQRVWPGVEIVPILDETSIMPISQPEGTKAIIEGWVAGLPAWELAGLERAVLAGKGLLVAARLIVEWSEDMEHLREGVAAEQENFGVEQAARAASLEVTYQTDMWGEVEDVSTILRIPLWIAC